MARSYKTDWQYDDVIPADDINRWEGNMKEIDEELTPTIERKHIEEKNISGSTEFDAICTICQIGKIVILEFTMFVYKQSEAQKVLNIDIPKPKDYQQTFWVGITNTGEATSGSLYLDTDGTLKLQCVEGLIINDISDITMIYEIDEQGV